jgi:ketosteroid isomerase-like protein
MTPRFSRHMPHLRTALSGALAGCVTTVVFTVLHHLLISDIWFSLVPMLVVGALCGASLAWSYGLLFPAPAVRSWIGYNAAYLALLVALGAGSIIVFEPITSTAALMAAGGAPPPELFRGALPFAIGFTLAAVAALGLLWARTVAGWAALLWTCAMVVFLFGLNISLIGLVELGPEGAYLVGLFFALTAAILAVNAAAFAGLERRRLFAGARDADDGRQPVRPRSSIVAGALVAIVTGAATAGCGAGVPGDDDRDALAALERASHQRWLEGDLAALDDLMADDFHFIAMNGALEPKSLILGTGEHAGPRGERVLRVERLEVETEEVYVRGNTAIVIALMYLDATVRGRPVPAQHRVLSVFMRDDADGRWRLTARSATPILAPPGEQD